MPTSFAIKHNASRRKPLALRLGIYNHQPHSFTSRAGASREAANGNSIYVIETRRTKSGTTYWLGYCFVSIGSKPEPSGGKWDGEFDFMNVSAPPFPAQGRYFDEPVEIEDAAFIEWFTPQQGMVAVSPSPSFCVKLETMLLNPALGAKACA